MNKLLRPQRILWILGIVLLVGTAAGSGWVLNHSGDGQGDKDAKPAISATEGIICIGFVDMELGTIPLHPLQAGRVVALYVKENEPVAKGQMLLSVDNTQHRHTLARAEADLAAAEKNVAKAELAVTVAESKVTQQENAVAVAKANQKALEADLAHHQRLFDLKPPQLSEKQLEVFKAKVEAATALAKAEEAKLDEARDYPKLQVLEVGRARDEVKAKQAQVELARLAVYECDVYAPHDGTILRVMTPGVGDVLTAQPKMPAVQFCPAGPRIVRAEVQQEWASKIETGQLALIEDDTRANDQWQGKVYRVSDWFSHRRSMLVEPFQYNDVRTLEVLIAVEPGVRPLRIGQRLRVTIKQGGP